MPINQSLKLSLYQKQKNIVLYFLGLFCVITIVYASNYYWAVLLTALIIGLIFLSNNQFVKAKNTESGILVLLSISILTMSFAQSIGNDVPIWLFNLVVIFQVLFLVENPKQQFALVVLNIFSGMFISYLQEQPISFMLSRGVVLSLFSIYGYNTIKSLLKSAESLQQEVEDKIKLNIALFNARAFQRQVLDSTNYAIIAIDENGKIVEFNKGAEILLGYEADDVLGKLDPVVFYDEEELLKRTNEIIRKYDAGIKFGMDTILFKNKIGLQNTSEWVFKTSSAKKIMVQSTINNIKDENGKIVGYIIVSIDITEKKQQEENLQTAETIITNGPSVLIKWLPESTRKIIYVSSNIQKILGYTTVEITKKDFDFDTLIHTTDIRKVNEVVDAATLNKTNSFIIEYRIRNKQNNWVWVEESSFIRTNKEGETLWYEGMLTDITNKKLTTDKLINTENRYELAMNSTNAGVWEWVRNNDDENLWWSDRLYEMLGYSANEIAPTYDLFLAKLHPDDMHAFNKSQVMNNNNSQSYRIKFRMQTKNGLYKWFLTSGKTITNEFGEAIKVNGSMIDISDKRYYDDIISVSDEYLKNFTDMANDCFFTVNSNGYFIFSNNAANTLFGYSSNELINKKLTEFIAEEFIKPTELFLRDIKMLDLELQTLTIPIKYSNNTQTWVKLKIKANFTQQVLNSYQFSAQITNLIQTTN